MIQVEIKNKKNTINEVIVSGHAGFADAGKDIVCAAVSTLVTTSVNNILALDESVEVLQSDALLTINVKEITEINQTLLSCMKVMLQDIAIDYPTNLKIKED